MTKEELNEVFDRCKELRQGIRIELEMPGQKDPEIIINTYNSLEAKRKYYDRTYDNNLIHKNNPRIKIIAAYPIRVKLKAKEVCVWK